MKRTYFDQKSVERAKQEVFDAVRFLSPTDLHQMFAELAEATKQLAEDYDKKLGDLILS